MARLGPADGTVLPDLFEATVRHFGRNGALEYDGESLSYAELDAVSNRWAHWLRRQGVRRGMRVAFWLPRGLDVHAVLLGVLKAGAAYVPLDPACPLDRVRFIVQDSESRCLITTAGFSSTGIERISPMFLIEELRQQLTSMPSSSPDRRDVGLGSEDEAYVIYTSGTTGRPKGVSILHRSVVHLVRAEGDLFGVHSRDRVFQGFSLAFDASVEEMWLAYRSGATLVVSSSEMVRSGPELGQRLAQARITVLSCVPTLLQMMGDEAETVRLLIVGGEACPPNLVQRWARHGRRMFNTYGPTEATVVATCGECHADRPVTIGRALPGYRALIVDEQLRPRACGEAGELLLGGIGLSRGYVGLPELTREKFIPDPFAAPGEPDARLYRTGDLCRFTEDGEIEYLGRIDGQVKIRGYRVELSEIDAVLLTHPSVRAAAVTLREETTSTSRQPSAPDQPGGPDPPDGPNEARVKHLVAYIVPRRGESVDEGALREFVRRQLPAYMVPALFETIDELPTLPSGKVDRGRLPAPRSRTALIDDGEVTAAEAALLEIWRRLFAPLPVSVTSDFFRDLGGDSLSAAGMISELRRRPEFRGASMFAIYQHPTIRQFTAALGELNAASAPSSAAASLTDSPRALDGQHDVAQRRSGGLDGKTRRDGPVVSSRASSVRFALCGAGQLIGLQLVMGLSGLQWLTPFLTYSFLHDSGYGVLESLLGGMIVLIVLYPPSVLLIVALKWLLLGRVRAGSYPLWGWFYWRWWLVRAVESVIPINYLVGTPLLAWYARLMGARVGRAVHLGTDALGTYDLLTIGDGSAIGADSSLLGYSVSDGQLTLGPISVGRECYLGARTLLRERVTMEDGSRLEDLSMLPTGSVVRRGETWRGSPAVCCERGRDVPAELTTRHGRASRRFWFGLAQTIGVLIMPAVVVMALLPGMASMHHLNAADEYYWYLLLSPAIGLTFVALLATQIAVLKWIVLGRVRPGTYPLYGGFSLRKWCIDQLLDLSVDVLGPLYSTLYLTPWYRALGARLGRLAEVSTASFISPDLLSLGNESFIADVVSLGAARVEEGRITVDHVRVGSRSFVGNSAVIPPGTTIGDDCLIGCLSLPPWAGSRPARVSDGSSWVGSPAMELPRRAVNQKFSIEQTYAPPRRLIALRLCIELFRVALPSAGFLCVAGLMFSFVAILRDEIPFWTLCLLFPLLYTTSAAIFVSIVVALKWLLMGKYRPCEHPLWSVFVWRTELTTALHDFFVGPLVLEPLRGTPFLAWYFRLMGTSVGQRVFLDTIQISEFDLARIDDDACLNADATLQTHLFEDRVMKMSHVHVGRGCSIGAESLVLYDTRILDGATLGGLSLLMKGEVLPPGTHWEGTPARMET